MAKKHTDSSGREYVVVEKGDTLSGIARDYAGGASNYKQLATINSISNPDRIYIGQKIYLTKSSSGSGSSSSASNSNSSNKPTINQFGPLSTDDTTLFATWTWNKSNTASYKVLWTYDTGNGVWLVGTNSTINVDDDDPSISKQSTYSIPQNARKVRFKVKPISKTYKKNDTEVNYWDADWSEVKTWTDSTPLETPSTPTIEIDKYKLTMSLDNITLDAEGIEFQVVKNNASTPFKKSLKAKIVTAQASYSCTVDAGGEYKVRCRAYKGSDYSEWSQYSSSVKTIPAASNGITAIRANSETSVYLEWSGAATATSYDIEYASKKEYFDISDQTTTKNTGENVTKYTINGLESGAEYFFRVRAVNDSGSSGWSAIKSVVIGKKPAAPTTWSSTTTAITGESVNLYWVHNTEDGSSQTYAQLELYINGVKESHDIKNSTDEDEKDKTSSYVVSTSAYTEGTKIEWRVRTAGVTKVYGDWSIQRSIDVYAPPTLDLRMVDSKNNSIDTLTAFPFYIHGLPSPTTQAPVGYHLAVISNEVYETVDNAGNPKNVNIGDEVYSKYFDISQSLTVEFSANNIDLENNVSYEIKCTVSMNSGLTAEATLPFSVNWIDIEYAPNAEIGIDEDAFTASIRPYCDDRKIVYSKVTLSSGVYTETSEVIDFVYGEIVNGAKTTSGKQVYSGMTADGKDVYYCLNEKIMPVTDVLLSVYRREFDGGFTELAKNLDGSKSTTITDPHPALDYARYRIVAVSKTTGAVSYYDPPGYPVGGKSVILQWDEAWSSFETSEESALEQPPWTGSMLKLPYNIDVSDNPSPDVAHVNYIGRSHPVSYYGTQLGHSATWNTVIKKDDKETLYGLRRLSTWMGDVYVREPSGSGYWATVTVSFSQKHSDLTIPVTLNIVRVEGGA